MASQQEIVFSAMEVDPSGLLKSTEEWECKDLPVDYARILIDGNTYLPRYTGSMESFTRRPLNWMCRRAAAKPTK